MSEEPAPAIRRPRRSGDEVERSVLAAARTLLTEVGYAAFSVEAVAERSDTAKTTIYRRFRNKADLATAALASFADPPDELPLPDDPRAALVEFLRRFRARMDARGMGVLASMLNDAEDPELLELHRERIIRPRSAVARGLLRTAIERGEIRADVDVDLALEMAVGAYFAGHLAGRPATSDWAERVVATLWDGVRVRPSADADR